jgi:hypothetical protein
VCHGVQDRRDSQDHPPGHQEAHRGWPPASAAFIGDDGWATSTGRLLGVPNFGTLAFTNCLMDGKTLASWHPREYQRVNHAGIVQIAPGALSSAGTGFATSYNHS